MLVPALFTVCLLGFASSTLAADKRITSPRGTFTITQYNDGHWTSRLQFAKSSKPGIVLTRTYPWPGQFYVSPDDQWVLQVQKSGSGDNSSFLYRLEPTGGFWRLEPRFGERALEYLQRGRGFTPKVLYHTGIEFRTWNLRTGALYFTVHGTSTGEKDQSLNQRLIYDLRKRTFRISLANR